MRARSRRCRAGDLAAITRCSRELRSAVEARRLPADVGASSSAAHMTLLREHRAAGGGALVGDHRGRRRREFRRTAGHLPVGVGAAAVLRCACALLGQPVFGGVDQLPPRQGHSGERAWRWRWWCRCMVDARTAGVMFTRSPTTGDRSVVTIEGAWGLGSAVVGGEVTPDRWVHRQDHR